ncbi:MAG: hypothetical protein WCO25_04690 [Candidatus Uhrbacteria bacterium]
MNRRSKDSVLDASWVRKAAGIAIVLVVAGVVVASRGEDAAENEIDENVEIAANVEEPVPVVMPETTQPKPTTPVVTPTPSPTQNPTQTPTPSPIPVPTPTPVVPAPAPAPAPTPVIPVVTLAYKNGSYTAAGNYNAPDGYMAMDVTLTVKDDLITAVSIGKKATGGTSMQYQKMFASGCTMMVVGQKLSDLKLSKVSGASLTTRGFNSALASIRAQAAV